MGILILCRGSWVHSLCRRVLCLGSWWRLLRCFCLMESQISFLFLSVSKVWMFLVCHIFLLHYIQHLKHAVRGIDIDVAVRDLLDCCFCWSMTWPCLLDMFFSVQWLLRALRVPKGTMLLVKVTVLEPIQLLCVACAEGHLYLPSLSFYFLVNAWQHVTGITIPS